MIEREKIIPVLAGLRRIVVRSLAVIAASGIVSFFCAKGILRFLQRTAGIKVYYLTLPEALLSSVELALYGGVFFALPVIVFLIWYEFRNALRLRPLQSCLFLLFSTLLFYGGCTFSYYIVLPSGIKFLIGYGAGNNIMPMISMERFVVFCSAMIFAFGITFELPLVLLMLGRLGIVKAQALAKTRRFAVLFIAIGAALITPTPDVYNMSLLAVPTYILFEIGIFLMKAMERRTKVPPGSN
jgi:sec-independent protein translocase protein TatC